MVGLVLIAHSQQLAQGIEEVLRQMVGASAPIALAAGAPNPAAPIGTEPTRVARAIESVYSEDGVVVLMDLGSAVMSGEAALDFLPPVWREHIHLCEAPLVEGAVAAAVAAANGAQLAQVMADARAALSFKQAQLAPVLTDTRQDARPEETSSSASCCLEHTLTLLAPNPMGLHLRPAARLVEVVGRYTADVTVAHRGKRASAKSINQLVMLNVRQGDSFIVHAVGDDALAALAAIQALTADNFGDASALEQKDACAREDALPVGLEDDILTGVPTVTGVAFGPVVWLSDADLPAVEAVAPDPEKEWMRLLHAVQTVKADLRHLRVEAAQTASDAAAIFDAQAAMLTDPDLLHSARVLLDERRISAEAAWRQTVDTLAENFRQLENTYLAQRSADVSDIGRRVLAALTGHEVEIGPDKSVILATIDLRLSDLLRLPRDRILGIVTATGGAAGHAAILARALGIPTVTGIGMMLRRVVEGQVIALDGGRGRVWLAPPSSLLEEFRQTQSLLRAQQDTARAQARLPAALRDGKRILVQANIDSPLDVPVALANGAEGVGVFRTEYLLMERSAPPDEDEQEHIYRTIAQSLGGEPLVVRTFDIGGDKAIPFLKMPPEANPFLGRRGIRLSLVERTLFCTQLRSLLRAAVECDIRIMLPMVSTLQEVQETRAILANLRQELERAGVSHRGDLPLGVMIETPAAVICAPALARAADFFSVGVNDLAQYVMAADRNNPAVNRLVSPFQPAVLHSLSAAVQAAHAAGIPISVCGEVAADLRATPLLIGLGVDELSMSVPAIASAKERIRHWELAQAQKVADRALSLSSAEDVIGFLEQYA
jgi:phosphocarrier protein FPr